jgi:hypothetical protein
VRTFTEIAQQMKVSRSTAHGLVRAAVDDLVAECVAKASAIVELELARLDAMLASGVYAKAVRGDLAYIDTCLRIHDRRAALLGLAAPKRTEAKQAVEGPPVEIRFAPWPDGPEEPVEDALVGPPLQACRRLGHKAPKTADFGAFTSELEVQNWASFWLKSGA